MKKHASLKNLPYSGGLTHSVSDIDDESSRGQWRQGGKATLYSNLLA